MKRAQQQQQCCQRNHATATGATASLAGKTITRQILPITMLLLTWPYDVRAQAAIIKTTTTATTAATAIDKNALQATGILLATTTKAHTIMPAISTPKASKYPKIAATAAENYTNNDDTAWEWQHNYTWNNTIATLITELNELSAHQYCLDNRNSFADLFTIVLYALVCVIGLFGNTLVIYVVLRYSKMQTVTNIYILNLAIADECFLIGIPFLIYTMRICSWKFGEYMCKAYMVSTSITQFTSSIFLLIMSADRYLAVCHPIASPKYRTLRIAKLVSAIAWLTSVVLMMPVILYASTVQQEDGIHLSCNIDWPEQYKTHSGTTFILYTFFLGFATPLCFILAFYYLVIRKLHAVGPKHKSKEKKRTHRKVTRLVLTVITVYILCWLPHWISQVALINSNPAQRDLSRLEILIFLLLGCLVYSNSAMNPILYAFLSDNFRKSFSKAFTCMARQDVNAQLQLEPSVFTKQGSRRRGGSKRLLNPMHRHNEHQLQQQHKHQQQQQQQQQCPTAAGNNNSSAATSSTTTNTDKTTTAVGAASSTTPATTSTGRCTSLTTNGRAENVVLVLSHEETVCAFLERTNQEQKDKEMQQTNV